MWRIQPQECGTSPKEIYKGTEAQIIRSDQALLLCFNKKCFAQKYNIIHFSTLLNKFIKNTFQL